MPVVVVRALWALGGVVGLGAIGGGYSFSREVGKGVREALPLIVGGAVVFMVVQAAQK